MNIEITCYPASPPAITSIDWSMRRSFPRFAMPSREKSCSKDGLADEKLPSLQRAIHRDAIWATSGSVPARRNETHRGKDRSHRRSGVEMLRLRLCMTLESGGKFKV